ncbi:MAG: toprim domain-containing protein [Deltaproteobacteria bacterium]|nr:toprim domain-containing protein [Deltaproteobacteria bacterium]
MIDTITLKKSIKIEAIARKLMIPLHGDCPTGHDSKDHNCFHVDTQNGLFHCFSCGIGGDGIKLVMLSHGCDFKDAVSWITNSFDLQDIPSLSSSSYPAHRRQSGNAENHGQSGIPEFEKMTKPPDAWLTWAADLQRRAAETLLVQTAEPYRRYLADRGISREGAERFGLGCSFYNEFIRRCDIGLDGDQDKKLCVPGPSILIPNVRRIDGQAVIIGFKIRRLAGPGLAKYGKYQSIIVPGAVGCMVIGDNPKLPVIIVEGEFDAILLSQIAGDMTNVVSLGSASNRPDEESFSFIKQSPVVLNALDGDDAGSKAAWSGWLGKLSNAYRLVLPKRADGQRYKDPTEYYQSGGDLRLWVKAGLKLADKERNQNPLTRTAEPVILMPEPGPVAPEPVEAVLYVDLKTGRHFPADSFRLGEAIIKNGRRFTRLTPAVYAKLYQLWKQPETPEDVRNRIEQIDGWADKHLDKAKLRAACG